MFRFWYRFVPNNNSVIMRGAADIVYRRTLTATFGIYGCCV